MPKAVDEYEALVDKNKIWLERTVGLGFLSADDAIASTASTCSRSATRPSRSRRRSSSRCGATTCFEGYLRPIVYLGYGAMGLGSLEPPVRTVVAAYDGADLGEEGLRRGIRAKVSSFKRGAVDSG